MGGPTQGRILDAPLTLHGMGCVLFCDSAPAPDVDG